MESSSGPTGQQPVDPTDVLPTFEDGRPIVRISLDEQRTADDAIRVLAARRDVFARLNKLVRVQTSDAGPSNVGEILAPTVRELLAESSVFCRDSRKGWKREKCPQFLVPAIRSRGFWPGVPELAAVVHTPVFASDGSFRAVRGYDPKTATYYEPRCELPALPEAPSQAQARAAAALICDVVREFPFQTSSDLTGFLAAFLTPFAQYAYSGPAPLMLFDKNSPGIGASKLCDVISIVHSGFSMERSAFPKDETELSKTISSYVLEGERWCLLDNLRGQLGGSVIELALTSERWKARLLGLNSTVRGRLDLIWFATANNVTLTPDVARRALQIRLESNHERPDEIVHERPYLLEDVRTMRPQLVAAGITMLRGYFAAGCPEPADLRPWGSFDGWSRLVQGCLLWLGFAPLSVNRARLRQDADTETAELLEVLNRIQPVFKNRTTGLMEWLTAGEILQRIASEPERFKALRLSLEVFLKSRPNEPLSARKLGTSFGSYRNKVCGGLRIRRSASHGPNGYEWIVESAPTETVAEQAIAQIQSTEPAPGPSAESFDLPMDPEPYEDDPML